MNIEYLEDNKLVKELENGIGREELLVYYQPVVDVITEKIVSAEALVRWKHHEIGFVSPTVFVPVLEKKGRISVLDQYVLQKVGAFLVERKKSKRAIIPIAINISWMDFYDLNMMSWFIKQLQRYKKIDIPIGIEITETFYTAIDQNQKILLNEIKRYGTELLMDDFGTGYSSLEMLQNIDFDVLKIDISFVCQIETNRKTREILRSIIAMAHELNMKLIAEGVETKKQLKFLKECGCDYIQGYYYYKPMSEGDFSGLLEQV